MKEAEKRKEAAKVAGTIIGDALKTAIIVLLWEMFGLVGPVAYFAFRWCVSLVDLVRRR